MARMPMRQAMATIFTIPKVLPNVARAAIQRRSPISSRKIDMGGRARARPFFPAVIRFSTFCNVLPRAEPN